MDEVEDLCLHDFSQPVHVALLEDRKESHAHFTVEYVIGNLDAHYTVIGLDAHVPVISHYKRHGLLTS